MSMKPILDACCGGKMFYFDKSDGRVLFYLAVYLLVDKLIIETFSFVG